MCKVLAKSSAIGAAALMALIGGTGVANAASDTYTQHSVEIGANNGGIAEVWICNFQSATNSYHFWVTDTKSGGYEPLFDTTTGDVVTNSTVTVTLGSGECKFFNIFLYQTIQVWASSGGSWTFGTNPISYD